MKVHSYLLQHIHLNPTYSLLSAKNVVILHEIFKILDLHEKGLLNGNAAIIRSILLNANLVSTSAFLF